MIRNVRMGDIKAVYDLLAYFAKQELRARGSDEIAEPLAAWVKTLPEGSLHAKLEALWTYQHFNQLNEELMRELLGSELPQARTAALRTLYHRHNEVEDSTWRKLIGLGVLTVGSLR